MWTAAPALEDFEAVAEEPAAAAAEPEPDALVVIARPDEPAAPPAVAELAAEEREEFMLRKEDWRPARPVVLWEMAEKLATGVMPAPAALVMVVALAAIALALLMRELKWAV